MSLKIKSGTDMESLREFGFAPGAELVERPEFAEYFDGREYQLPWWHRFEVDPDSNTGAPMLDEDGLPRVHAWVDTRDGQNLLWFGVVPYDTYLVEMDDLDLVTTTVFSLTRAGFIEDAETKKIVETEGLTLNEIISSLEDQARDRDSSVDKDDPDCIFRHDAAALRAAVVLLRNLGVKL